MNNFLRHPLGIVRSLAVGIAAFPVASAFAAGQVADPVWITGVAVNGGADTLNPGTTCITVSAPLVAACPAGYVAIPNNNRLLIAAALQARATLSKVWFYYDDSAGASHCPGHVFTPCGVISIELKQ